MRNELTIEQREILGGFANRMASTAIHRRDQDAVYWGLLAVFAEDLIEDPRESVIRQSLLYTSCQILGIDFQEICFCATLYGPDITRDAIEMYIARPEEAKGAKAMNYAVDLESVHITCKRNWDWE